MHICDNPVNSITILLEFFVAEFMVNDQVDDQRSTDPNRQAGNIDHGKNLISPEISKRDEEIILDHRTISMSKFSTLVPITELPVKQGISHNFFLKVSENGQYTYIFVHVNVSH